MTSTAQTFVQEQKLGLDFMSHSGLGVVMEDHRRDLINHIDSELAGIMDDASAEAATLRGVPVDRLGAAVEKLAGAAARAQALTTAMQALVQQG